MIGFRLVRRCRTDGRLARYLGIPCRVGPLSSWQRQVVRRPLTQARLSAAARRWHRRAKAVRRATLEFAKTLMRNASLLPPCAASLSACIPNVAKMLAAADRHLFIFDSISDAAVVLDQPTAEPAR